MHFATNVLTDIKLGDGVANVEAPSVWGAKSHTLGSARTNLVLPEGDSSAHRMGRSAMAEWHGAQSIESDRQNFLQKPQTPWFAQTPIERIDNALKSLSSPSLKPEEPSSSPPSAFLGGTNRTVVQ